MIEPMETFAVQERLADKDWRVMGMWPKGEAFLVTLGVTEEDCRGRLAEALSEFSYEELSRLDSIWLEKWTFDDFWECWDWMPTEIVSLRVFRLRAAALERHELRRSA